jgi:nucleotide-binding universal stress UspA family protein
MFSHILLAWDGSPRARRAFDFALEVAVRFSARLQIVSIARSAEHAETEAERHDSLDEAKTFYERRREELLSVAQRRGVAAQFRVLPGTHPAEELVAEIKRSGADLVVLGRRGMSPVERFIMGSVSDRVARYSPCPVLIVGEA